MNWSLVRLFSAVRHSSDPSQFYGGMWSANFHPALRRLGHDVIESQTDLFPSSRFMDVAENFTRDQLETRAKITERILDEIRAAHLAQPLDACLLYFYNAHFDPAGIRDIHALGIPTINFFCNSIYQFPLVANIANRVTFSWHPERDARQSYLAVGGNPVWVQMGADPDLNHPVPNVARAPRACFVGQRYADREFLLAHLIVGGVPVDIYGSGWANNEVELVGTSWEGARMDRIMRYLRVIRQNISGSGLPGGIARTALQLRHVYRSRSARAVCATAARGRAADLAETFAQHDVVLNFSNVWSDGRSGSKLLSHVRLRDFEAPMCGSCYLTGQTNEIAEFYDIGEEIDTYATADELLDKTRYYLANPDAAEKLRGAGYRRARRDHTWERRFEELFGKTDLL